MGIVLVDGRSNQLVSRWECFDEAGVELRDACADLTAQLTVVTVDYLCWQRFYR